MKGFVFISIPYLRHGLAGMFMLCLASCLVSEVAAADATIPGFYGATGSTAVTAPSVNALPVLDEVIQNAELEKTADNELVVHQSDEKAIINWKSFNIGANASTYFEQQGNTDWAALNRIYDQNPSLIYGRLTADGRVFLVNQNGILFGAGSQVNVHSLVGSALNIDDDDFLGGVLSFHLDNYIGQDYEDAEISYEDSCVANHGTIETGQGGWAFLLGPEVENGGTITSPVGQVGLAAGTEVDLEWEQDYDNNSERVARLVNVKDDGAGTASNLASGQILADMGTAGMYGRIVNQDGLIRSVTAVAKDGNIELIASEKVSLGEDSNTICPVDDSTEEVHESFKFSGGDIRIMSHDEDDPRSYTELPTQRIEIYGTVAAPSGNVDILASERIYMESGSTIDVSGSIVGNTAQDSVIEAQLNSVEMADEYGQKDGLLEGEYISFTTQEGSSIGDVSAYMDSEEKTAGEFSTKGGNVYLTCETGDIIIKGKSTIDFSGGGIYYTAGTIDTTKLVSGNQIYDISDAPDWIEYDQILGSFEKTYDRYGITEEYTGLQYGGPGAVKELASNYFQGDDAGVLELVAPRIVLEGVLDGSVTTGAYQTIWDPYDEGNIATSMPVGGTLRIGVRVETDEWSSAEGNNKLVEEIVIQGMVSPSSGLTADSELTSASSDGSDLHYSSGDVVYQTVLRADTLNAAGLSTLYLGTNTRLTIEPDVTLSLSPGGEVRSWARQFDIEGEIIVPSGSIILAACESYTAATILKDDTENPDYVELDGGIYLGENSILSTAGEQVDNTLVAVNEDQSLQQGLLDGGTIKLQDETNANFENGIVGLDISDGAILDVSGGFQIDPDGSLTGGDAGTLKLYAPEIELDGSLYGYSLEGWDGGTLELFATQLTIVPAGDEVYPEELQGLILFDDRFSNTGFSNFHFKSREDLTIAEGTNLMPSLVKLDHPESAQSETDTSDQLETDASESDEELYPASDLVSISMEYIGDSSITLEANQEFDRTSAEGIPYSWITVGSDSEIQVAPAGSIELHATGIQVAGSLIAPAGSIVLEAQADQESFDLILEDTASLLAYGVNIPDRDLLIDGEPTTYTSLDGGTVSLTSSNGDITVASGAVIDVSGSAPVEQIYTDADGGIHTRTIASNPGEIQFSFWEDLDLQPGAVLKADGQVSGIQGGSLTIENTNESRALAIAPAEIVAAATDDSDTEESYFVLELDQFLTAEAGFDSLTLVSDHSILFQGDLDLETGREITLDSPLIQAEGDAQVQLTSPWVTLTNTKLVDTYPQSSLETGEATLSVVADWIDLAGYNQFSGFGDSETVGISLSAERDIRLADFVYTSAGSGLKKWHGYLQSSGSLNLTADCIYPTIHEGIPSDFTFETNGTFSTRSSGYDSTDSIYSFGGSISILADRIDHEGSLAAPGGQIIIAKSVSTGVDENGDTVINYEPAERIYLAPDSKLSTTGEISVYYGTFDEEGIDWYYNDKTTTDITANTLVSEAPENQVLLVGDEVIVRQGSEIDASGGGELFSYLFLPGVEGTSNPLEADGLYVIVPDNQIQYPGESIYLEGVEGLADGTYILLPEEFAFMTDAIVIQEIGVNTTVERNRFTDEGYQIASGYKLIAGTDIQSPVVYDYAIRSAEDVLAEGDFTTDSMICGDAGNITIQGDTTIINGSISGSALPADPTTGYVGGEAGILSLAGAEVQIGEEAAAVDIIFSHEVEDEYENILSIDSDSLNGGDLGEIRIGDEDITETITLFDGSSITSQTVTLVAQDEILLKDGSAIVALGTTDEEGVASLTAGNRIAVEGSATITATNQVVLDTNQLELGSGSLVMDNSTLTLKSDSIYLASAGYEADNLVLTASMWDQIIGASIIELESQSDIYFQGGVDLNLDTGLSLEAGRLVALDAHSVNLAAPSITLTGKQTLAAAEEIDNTGTIDLQASEELIIQGGNILLQGFSDIQMGSQGAFTFKGEGSLATSGGDLILSAGTIQTDYYQPADETSAGDSKSDTTHTQDFSTYEPADFFIDAGTGDITLSALAAVTVAENSSSGGTTPGGQLAFSGNSIEISNTVDLPSGYLTCIAGDGNITLTDSARIAAVGTDSAPGGQVDFRITGTGNIGLAENAVIDVSAGTQGDAGSVSLSAPSGNVDLNGSVLAVSSGGMGGSFSLDAGQILDLSAVTTHLTGVTRSIDLRSRTGDVALDTDLAAESVTVTADSGSIALTAAVSSDSATGGSWVELNADNDVTLAAGSRIDARGTGTDADGGTVFINAAQGDIQFADGAAITVSGNGEGQDGLVTFRALRQGADSVQMELNGTVTGAAAIQAEAVAVYEDVSVIESADYEIAALTYMNAVASGTTVQDILDTMVVEDRNGATLSSADEADLFQFIPGIEIRSAADGDLELDDDWDLSFTRYDGLPGALTLRSAGDFLFYGTLIDAPTDEDDLSGRSGNDSWGIRLIAGADFTSPDLMATQEDSGELLVFEEQQVYTESGSLWFASGGDTTLFPGDQPGFYLDIPLLTLGTYDGNIQGDVGGSLSLIGGIIQSSTGDIQVSIQEDLIITSADSTYGVGAIRTIGQAPDSALFSNLLNEADVTRIFWEYENGGDIELNIGGTVDGDVDLSEWDDANKISDISTTDGLLLNNLEEAYIWSAYHDGSSATKGIATLAGGDIRIQCAGDFVSQVGTFGTGNLSIYAGGNLDGHFLVSDGVGRLSAMGSMGTLATLENQTIEIMDAQVWVDAQGHINLGTVINPTIAGVSFQNKSKYWNLTYSYEGQTEDAENSAIYLTSFTGDVSLSGEADFEIMAMRGIQRILPSVVAIQANGDIYIQNQFTLAPSPTGNLTLSAGDSIYGYSAESTTTFGKFLMPDVDPDLIYGYQDLDNEYLLNSNNEIVKTGLIKLLSTELFGYSPDQSLHLNDATAVSITASEDIEKLKLILSKKAEIYAGNNILDLYYHGQNLSAGDVTSIIAGNSIQYSTEGATVLDTEKEIQIGGPGLLWVSAGNQIDLGATDGITAIGNLLNPILPEDGASVVVVTGYDLDKNESDLQEFFDSVRSAGVDYSNLLAEGDTEAADEIVQNLRDTIIEPFLTSAGDEDTPAGGEESFTASALGDSDEDQQGNLNMVQSQISTTGKDSNIYIYTKGDLNVGRTTFKDDSEEASNTGIYTANGGSIDIYSYGDVNVNESRVMTFYGGSISVWSDYGNINAGRGSKTAVSATAASATMNEAGEYVLSFNPPAVGSGIRTLTFDPDGAAGSQTAPEAGDVYLFAPYGEIDAGEAGISGSNVILGALSVVNVQNISFSQGAVGVPSTSEATATVGALSGGGAVSEASKMADASAAIQAANKQFEQDAKAMEKTFMPTWLKVQFMGFDVEDEGWAEEEDDET